MAEKLPMSVLTRTWQMLLKGIDETLKAPSEKQAAEMVLIRLAYAADLPTPGDMIKEIKSGGISVSAAQTSAAPSVPPAGSAQSGWSGVRISGNTVPAVQTRPQETVMFNSLADIAAYAYKQNEMMFAYNVENFVSLVSFEQGKIEFFPMDRAPNNLAGEMVEKLRQWTGRQWIVTVVGRQGGQTLIQQARTNAENLKKTMTQHPLVTAVLKAFPGARIDTIRLQKEEENESEEYGYETDSFSEAAAQPNEGYDE